MRRGSHTLTLALLVVAGTSFALMQTLVVPALPFFQREFDTTPAWTTWLVTSFLISSSVLTPIIGKLGDAHGKKRLLAISLLVFATASVGAAAAPSIQVLIGFRALQGVGAAIFPLAFGLIRDEFPAERVGVAIGTVSSVFGIGGGLGLVLSGVIVEHLDRHWLFLVGAVPVYAAAALVIRYVPESALKTPTRPDYAGAATLSVALGALLLAVTSPSVGLFAAAAVGFVAFVHVERRNAEPLVDLKTLARAGMAATNASTALVGFAMTAFFVLVPGFLQSEAAGFGLTPTQAGLILTPFSLAMIAAGPLAGRIGTRHGRALPLRIGLGLGALSLTGLAALHTSQVLFALWMPIMGAGMAFALAAIGALVLDYSSPGETGVASGINTIMRTTGAAIGAQLAAAIVVAHHGDADGYTLAFGMAAVAALVAVLPSLALTRRSPAPEPVWT